MDVYVIFITYLALIRIIVVSFLGLFDRVFPGWDPGPDLHTPSLRKILRRRPSNPLKTTFGTAAENATIISAPAGASILSQSAIFNTNLLTSFQSIIAQNLPYLSSFPFVCISAEVELWCHRWSRFLVATPIAEVIHTYCFCVRHRRDTPVFRAYAGTVIDAIDCPQSIRFETVSYRVGIDTFAS